MKNRNEVLSPLRSEIDIVTVLNSTVKWKVYYSPLSNLSQIAHDLWNEPDATQVGIFIVSKGHKLAVKYERHWDKRSFIVMDTLGDGEWYTSDRSAFLTIWKIVSWVDHIIGYEDDINIYRNNFSRLKSKNWCRIMAITDITRMMVDVTLADTLSHASYALKTQEIGGVSITDYELPPQFMEYTQYVDDIPDYVERMNKRWVNTEVLEQQIKKYSKSWENKSKQERVHNSYNDILHKEYSDILSKSKLVERKDWARPPKVPTMSRYGVGEDILMWPLRPRASMKATEAAPLLSKYQKESEWSSCFSWCC